MEYSEWFPQGTKPDFNGVYQGRCTDRPDVIQYFLYKNGWHAGCDTANEAEKVIELFRPPKSSLNYELRGKVKVLKIGVGTVSSPTWEWRGLKTKPPGNYRFTPSDKLDRYL